MFKIVTLLALCSSTAFAQTTGVIRGTVLDEDELEVPQVSVTITSPSLIGGTRQTPTDNAGTYAFEDLLPGTYTVTASKEGFITTHISGIRVILDRTASQNIQLVVGEDPPFIPVTDQTGNVAGQVITEEFLRSIPTGRNYQQAVQTLACVGGAPRAIEWAQPVRDSPWHVVPQDHRSTFALDVGAHSWTDARWFLQQGTLPNPVGIHVEQMINAFDYDLPSPSGREAFAVDLEAGPYPFHEGTHLLRVGVQARRPARPDAHLVYVVSMADGARLQEVQHLLTTLVDRLKGGDTLAIVTDAQSIVLPPTSARKRGVILKAISGVGTQDVGDEAQSLQIAYRVARRHLEQGASTRVVLVTDRDPSVIGSAAMASQIREHQEMGIGLSTLGLLTGPPLIQRYADSNGRTVFLDSDRAVSTVLQEHIGGTPAVVARDVSIQLKFHEDAVQSWRLIGYRSDHTIRAKAEAAELREGHHVVAYYALVLQPDARGPLVDVTMGHKSPDGEASETRSWALHTPKIRPTATATSDGFQLGAAIATLGERLPEATCGQRYDDILEFIATLDRAEADEVAAVIDEVHAALGNCDR